MMSPGNLVSFKYMLLFYIKNGYGRFIQFNIYNFPNHFIDRQGAHLIFKIPFCDMFNPLPQFRNRQLKAVETDGLHADTEHFSQFLIRYKWIFLNCRL